MTVTSRILPPNEWHRLSETELPALIPHVSRGDMAIVVIEDGKDIVAAAALMFLPHFEGAWVAPDYRKRRSVFARLVNALFETARGRGVSWAMAGSATDEMRQLLTKHLHATKVPMDTYIVHTDQRCRH